MKTRYIIVHAALFATSFVVIPTTSSSAGETQYLTNAPPNNARYSTNAATASLRLQQQKLDTPRVKGTGKTNTPPEILKDALRLKEPTGWMLDRHTELRAGNLQDERNLANT